MTGRRLEIGMSGRDAWHDGARLDGSDGFAAPGRAARVHESVTMTAMPQRAERIVARYEPRQARRCARSGVALLSLALVAGVLAACGGDDAEKARIAAAVKTEQIAMPSPEPVSGATLVLTLVSAPASGTDATPSIPENVTYGDAEKVYSMGRYDEARDLFNAYVERKPENPWGRYMLGLAAWKSGDFELAETSLRKAAELSPNHVKSSLNLARVLLDAGKPEEAVESATRATDLDPANGAAWRVLGNALSDMGDYDGAEQAYREALVVDDTDAWSMNNLGLLRIRHGMYEEALPPLALAAELKPGSALFQNNLGVALERTGHLVEALESYRKAVEADSGHGKASASVERLEPVVAKAEPHPIDLTGLAGSFRDQIVAWRHGGTDPVPVPVEPVDTIGVVKVEVSPVTTDATGDVKPDTANGAGSGDVKLDTQVPPKVGGGSGHGC